MIRGDGGDDPTSARVDAGCSEARATKAGMETMQALVDQTRLTPLLHLADITTASNQGIVVRFNQNKATLVQELESGALTGHKVAVHHVAGMLM